VTNNPYKSPTKSCSANDDLNAIPIRPRWMHFRWHALTAVIVGFLIAGNPHEVESPLELHWIVYLSMMMTWGPWLAPINTLYWIATPIAVLILEVAKRVRPTKCTTLFVWQTAIWWAFWLLFGVAERFGRYDGP